MMNAITNVETVAQIGVIKMTGGIALYAARIREMDRDAMRRKVRTRGIVQKQQAHVERLGRE